jgi:hypothetical protein
MHENILNINRKTRELEWSYACLENSARRMQGLGHSYVRGVRNGDCHTAVAGKKSP